MSIRQGSNIISGSKRKELGLLTPQWYDYVLEDINWLRADSFSWHNGTIYTAVYQHLLSDIDGKTAQTETVSGTTITFYLADDGHKIIKRDQETAARTIYENTGIAWYYIIDETNHLFKLPRCRFDIYGGSQAESENMCLYFFAGNFAQSVIENFPTGPITGEVDWGVIGGTLSNQTDLQEALDSKVNKSGDTITGMTKMFVDSQPYSQQTVLKLGAKLESQSEPTSYASINVVPGTNALYIQGSIYSNGFHPNSDHCDLGSGVLQWRNLYVKNIKIYENSTTTTIDIPRANGTMALTSDIGDATLTIQKNNTTVDTFTANAKTDKTINITVPTTAADVSALPSSTKYAANIAFSINSSTYVLTAQLKDQDGNNLGSAQTVDLPLESVVVSGSYDSQNKKIVLTLQNGQTIEFSVADLISGLQTEITSQNKLDADLVDDSTSTNKFVTATDKTTWSGKQDAISDLSTIRSNASAGASAATTISGYGNIVTHSTSEFATSAQGNKADTALQPNDNVSSLANDAGYLTAHQTLTDLGITATASEINVLDGITASTTELNYVDGVTSSIQTQLNSKEGTISDLSTIRSGAAAGATALQPGGNVSDLINDAGYLTSSTVPTEVVWATYGTTNITEIKNWVAANKIVMLKYNGDTYRLVSSTTRNEYFATFDYSGIGSKQIRCNESDGWSTVTEHPFQDKLPAGTAGNVVTYTGLVGQVGSTTLATVATSGKASDLDNDIGFITQDVNVNATEIQYALSSSNQQVSAVTTWNSQTSPLSDRQRSVCYGNGYWATAGASGSLAYSTNGTTWTAITPFCTGTITGITYGNGYFLAVEYESKKVWKSNTPDGTWTDIYTAEESIESIQYINNTFVITGENGLIAKSETGAVWDEKTTGINNNIIKAAYGNGMYVAVGASGTILTSINGDTWTSRTSGTVNDIRTVAYGNGKFVCGGKEILHSADGITWTAATTIPEQITGWVREFAYGEKRFYCSVYTSGGFGQIWYSSDCITWTNALNLITSNSRLWDMAFGNNIFVSSGDGGQIYTLDLNVSWLENRPAISSGDYLWYRNVIIQNNGSKIYSDAYYVSAGDDALPSQSGQSGKYLTTNGTTASWAAISTTLSGLTDTTISSPTSGQVLSYNGSVWVNSAPSPALVITDYTAS